MIYYLVLVIILSLGATFNGVWSALLYHKKLLTIKQLIILLYFSLSTYVLVIALKDYENYTQFSFLAITFTLWCIGVPFVMHIYIQDHKKAQFVVSLLFSLTYVFFLVARALDTKVGILYYRLPLNVCNYAAVMIAIRVLHRNKMFDNYILCFGLIGYLANFFLGFTYGIPIYDIECIVANVGHNFFIIFVIYYLISKQIKPNIKSALKNFIWIVPVFVVLWFFNELWEYNFFFTSRYANPITFLYNLFPRISFTWLNKPFEINIIYSVLIIGASLGALAGVSALEKLIWSKFIDRSISPAQE
ncbi:MAG: YwaF family protein [Acholeplasmatales bacterium]|jgi:hypothetical protein|nr:YwaF family protein [Acholeplasmatales bacterium]